MKEVRVEFKKDVIFTIPMNSKKPGDVRQSIKGLIEYISDRLNLTVESIHDVHEGLKLKEDYEVLEDWCRERQIKRIHDEGVGMTKKRIKINKGKL